MTAHRSVVWVGGLAHWQRIVARLETGEFVAPDVPVRSGRTFERARLAPSALLRLTGQWPWVVREFARAPEKFDPVDAVQALLHEAVHPRYDRRSQPPESRKCHRPRPRRPLRAQPGGHTPRVGTALTG